MKPLCACCVMVVTLAAAIAWGERPATLPSTRPADSGTGQTYPAVLVKAPDTRPATQPATTATTVPSLRETLARLKMQKEREQDLAKVAYIDLNRPIVEKPAEFVLFEDTNLTLQSVLARLRKAREQKDLRAVLLNIGATDLGLSQAVEIRDAITELNKAGKETFVYADSYDTPTYIAASSAKHICMLGGGQIMMPGLGMEPMFAKGLLDKVGVQADYIQIGQYKGADESFTRTEPSQELRGELNKLLDSLYEQMVEGIAYHRGLRRSEVVDAINGVFMTGRVARDRRFVDHLIDQDGLRDLLKTELGREIDLLHDFGRPRPEPLDLSNPFALLSRLSRKPPDSDRPAVALIYAEGVIVSGDAEEGIFSGGTIGSENMRKALRMAVRDENVRAIVLRIDSPGGDATASEVMWQSVRRAAAVKPLVVSIGGMAASGGYYLASGADRIFADPTAVVGSIGVVGGKFVMKDLFNKIGLHTETFTRGKNADLFSSNAPFTEPQRRLVTSWMKQTYELFTDRVMTTRRGKIKDIDQVAHGRIFAAKQAKELGMVDELGGIEHAIAFVAGQAGLEPGKYDIRVIPPTRSLMDLLRGDGDDEGPMETRLPLGAMLRLSPDSVLRLLPPAQLRLVRQQLQAMQVLQSRPVMLMSPYVIFVR